jgi:hypothetical protein
MGRFLKVEARDANDFPPKGEALFLPAGNARITP